MSGVGQMVSGFANAQIGSHAAQEAAGTQAQYGEAGLNTATTIYNAATGKYEPYIQTGTNAEKQLAADTGQGGSLGRAFTMADFNADPAYKFDVSQGLQAINNSNSVRGGALSGGTMKALSNYGEQQASNEYGSAAERFMQNQNQNFSQLSSLAGTGLNALNAQSQLGENYSNAQMGQLNGIGNALAAGTLGIAKAKEGGWTNVGQGFDKLASGLGTGMGS